MQIPGWGLVGGLLPTGFEALEPKTRVLSTNDVFVESFSESFSEIKG
jgi:hypothetical protein